MRENGDRLREEGGRAEGPSEPDQSQLFDFLLEICVVQILEFVWLKSINNYQKFCNSFEKYLLVFYHQLFLSTVVLRYVQRIPYRN